MVKSENLLNRKFMAEKEKIYLIQGDITDCATEAIVNAANTDLWLGSGVAGAILKKGGEEIQKECQRLGPIERGEAVVSGGAKLKARYVIHAASMSFDEETDEASLYDAVKNSLLRASELKIKSIAFPAIGTGVSGFDIRSCAEIMLSEILRLLPEMSDLQRVEIVLYDAESLAIFQEEYDRL